MFQWEAFLDIARDLARQTDNEAALRSALSRAYYAVLHLARLRLIDTGWTLPEGSIHHHVWRAYAGATDPRRRNIARRGNALKQWRNAADYKRAFPDVLQDTVTKALEYADELIALLEQVDADATRTR